MRKPLVISIISCVLSVSLAAQGNMSSQNLSAQLMLRTLHRGQSEQVVYKGYFIKLQPALAGNYGFDILNEGNLIISQRRNPFTNSPVGLQKKDDLIKLARWYIDQLNDGTSPGRLMHTPLTKSLSRDLGIKLR